MTAGEILAQLANTTGTAAALLLAIGAGATAGAALVNYSGLPSASAASHLLADVAPAPPSSGARRIYRAPAARKPVEEIEALLLTGLI